MRHVIVELQNRVADLEERLGRNPRNSSVPPSAELFAKPAAPSRAERRAAARKQGKQPGSPGKHLAQVADPDHVVHHAPHACTSCGSGLEDAEVLDAEARQVFEVPEVRLVVTEHVTEHVGDAGAGRRPKRPSRGKPLRLPATDPRSEHSPPTWPSTTIWP